LSEYLPKLIPEDVPDSAPAGSRAYRFIDYVQVIFGTLTSIRIIDGVLTYEIATIHSGERFRLRPQSKSEPAESHVIIAPGGYVDPALLQQ
jgi:hypothetical protein